MADYFTGPSLGPSGLACYINAPRSRWRRFARAVREAWLDLWWA